MAAIVDAIDLYEKLRLAPDEAVRARLIAQTFSALEARYPHLDDLVTTRELSETELRLIKEIELVRGELKVEIEQVRGETEKVRGELKQTELRLIKEIELVRSELKVEIEQVRAETEKVRSELKQTELRLTKEIEQVRAKIEVETEKLRSELKIEIEQVRSELKVEIARSHQGLLKWSFLFWLTQFGAIALLAWRVLGQTA